MSKKEVGIQKIPSFKFNSTQITIQSADLSSTFPNRFWAKIDRLDLDLTIYDSLIFIYGLIRLFFGFQLLTIAHHQLNSPKSDGDQGKGD